MTLLACRDTATARIGQLADVVGHRARNDEQVELHIVLDGTDPPAGRLRIVRSSRQAPYPEQDVAFVGWLGLLRVLYEVTTEPGERPTPRP